MLTRNSHRQMNKTTKSLIANAAQWDRSPRKHLKNDIKKNVFEILLNVNPIHSIQKLKVIE